MFRKIFFIFLLLILCIGAVSASENITDAALNEELDVGEHIVSESIEVDGDTFDDIQESVDNAKINDVVVLKENYTCSNKAISINKSITIEGIKDKTVLDANKKPGIFDIYNSNVTIKNIKFINSNGLGAVNIEKSDVTFINCIFENNVAGVGGAIRSNGGQTNIINCTFKNNSGDSNLLALGGAIAIISDDNSIGNQETNIYNSSFINNSAVDGGAIYIDSSGYITSKRSLLNIYNTHFNDNHITYDDTYFAAGADISIQSTSFDFTVINSDFNHSPSSIKDPINDAFIICANNSYFENSSFINSLFRFDNGVANFNNCSLEYCVIWSNYLYDKDYEEYYYDHPDEYKFDMSFDLFDSLFDHSSLSFNGKTDINNSEFISSSLDAYGSAMISKSNFTQSEIISNEGTVQINDCNFKGNENYISCEYSKLVLNNSNFLGKIHIDASKNKFTNCKGMDNIISPIKIKVISKPLVYKSGTTYKMKLTNSNFGNVMANFQFKVILYKDLDGKKLKTYTLKTNSKGIASIKGLSKLNAGKYFFTFKSSNDFFNDWDKEFTVKKIKTTVKAPKVISKYKKSKYFKITVKANKKVVKKIKIKVKVFTGKKYKTYKIKTNKKGVAKLNTKKLSKGSHKVVISSGNKNYKISAKSKIIIK